MTLCLKMAAWFLVIGSFAEQVQHPLGGVLSIGEIRVVAVLRSRPLVLHDGAHVGS